MSNQNVIAPAVHVLFIEDNPADFRLCLIELGKAGIECQADLVATPAQLMEKLNAKAYDAIVSDYHLPGWTGMEALKLAQAANESVPFILLTGVLGDDKAVECMRRGVSDFILKDRLSRLPAALLRALDDKRVREERLGEERRGRLPAAILDNMSDAVIAVDHAGQITYCNSAAQKLCSLKTGDLLNESIEGLPSDLTAGAGSTQLSDGMGAPRRVEATLMKAGEPVYLEVVIDMLRGADGNAGGLLLAARDITDRKKPSAQKSDGQIYDGVAQTNQSRQL